MFEKELDFFINHQDELVKKHEGKILALRGEEVVGVYDDTLEAYTKSQDQFPLGEVMLQPCVSGEYAYTVSISTLGIS